MSDKEKTLTAFLVIAALGVVALIGTIIAKEEDIQRYNAILDVACQRYYNPAQCKAGMKALKNMSPDDIRSYKDI